MIKPADEFRLQLCELQIEQPLLIQLHRTSHPRRKRGTFLSGLRLSLHFEHPVALADQAGPLEFESAKLVGTRSQNGLGCSDCLFSKKKLVQNDSCSVARCTYQVGVDTTKLAL